jgi:hypothetical protein
LEACTTSDLDAEEVEGAGEGREAEAGFEPETADARDATGGLPNVLAEGDCVNALTKPAAVFDARLPTDDETLDAMDAVAAAG